MTLRLKAYPLLVPALVLTVGCNVFHFKSFQPAPWAKVRLEGPPSRNLTAGCVDNYDSNIDYFPEKIRFEYAKQIQVEYFRNYKVIRFDPAVRTQETFRFVLVQCGTPPPPGFASSEIITVPSQRFVLNTPGYGDTVQRLGIVRQLVGVASLLAFTTPEIVARGQARQIHEVGNRSHSNLEPAILLEPDLVFLFYSAYPNSNLHPKLAELGVQGIPLADHFEPHPLGRSEWVKFLALFFNRESEADSIFRGAAGRYEELRAKAEHVTARPDVLLGFPSSRDIWSLNGGRNYMSNLVWHAGGHYFWTDHEAGSLVSADFEKVMDQSLASRTWLGGFGVIRVPDKRQLIRNEARLAYFTPVESGEVYAPDIGIDRRRATPFTSGSLDKPDVVLADLIAALHPELLPDHQPVFFRKLK